MPLVKASFEEPLKNLLKAGIECRPLIAGNIANKPFWFEHFYKPKLPNCEDIDRFGFYIPNHQDLTIEQLNMIVNIINYG